MVAGLPPTIAINISIDSAGLLCSGENMAGVGWRLEGDKKCLVYYTRPLRSCYL